MNLRHALLLALAVPAATWACCFPPDEPVFVARTPDAPWDDWLARPGVIVPDMAPRHLALLHRWFSGTAPDAMEQKALAEAWSFTYATTSAAQDASAAQARWVTARARELGHPDAGEPTPVELGIAENYGSYLHLHADAYDKAIERLKARRARYAKQPDLLREWVVRQDQVFGLSTEVAVPALDPQAIPAALAPQRSADLAYLEAARHFYAGEFELAARGFDALRDGEEAPWGGYLAARAYLRWATLDVAHEAETRAPRLAEAERRLRAAVTSADERVRGAATALLLKVKRLQAPATGWCEFVPLVAKAHQGSALPHELAAFEQWLGDPAACGEGPGPVPDLADWVRTFSSFYERRDAPAPTRAEWKKARAHALERWKKTKSRAWLVATLAGTVTPGPELDALVDAARQVEPADAAWPTVRWHLVRVLRAAGRVDEARAAWAEVPPASLAHLRSTRNAFQLEGLHLATSADEAVALAWLVPARTWNMDLGAAGRSLVADPFEGMRLLNRALDGSAMGVQALRQDLPLPLRRGLAWAAFARHALLQPEAPLTEDVATVLAVEPQAAKGLALVSGATDLATAHGSALKYLLEHPGASALLPQLDDRVYEGKDTPFSSAPYARYGCANFRNGWFEEKSEPGPLPAWGLGPATAEFQALQAGSGHVYARAALAFADAHPAHPLSPELLHLAVQHSLYSGGGDDVTKAFRALHRRYGQTKWARQTPIHW